MWYDSHRWICRGGPHQTHTGEAYEPWIQGQKRSDKKMTAKTDGFLPALCFLWYRKMNYSADSEQVCILMLMCVHDIVSHQRNPLIFVSQWMTTIMSVPVVWCECVAAACTRWERIQLPILWETSLEIGGPIMWARLLLLPLCSYNSGKRSAAQKSLFSEP